MKLERMFLGKHTRQETLSSIDPIISRRVETPTINRFRVFTDYDTRSQYAADTSKMEMRGTPGVIEFHRDSSTADIANVVMKLPRVIPIGARSAITGAGTPDNQYVLDLSRRNELKWGEDNKTVTVQTGITVRELQETLAERGLYYPPGPTFDGATIGGNIGTNAAGAATFKYGQTRSWVDAITVVLPNGQVMDIERGKYKAQKGKFEWKDAKGDVREIPVPTYTMPDVPKISAGYYAKPDMDLIDLFIGAEGTLGVVTEARLRVIPKPDITWALVSCESEEQALKLTKRLREQSKTTWRTQDSSGLDVSAIEYIDDRSVNLLREDSKIRKGITPPDNAKTLLLVQMEMGKEVKAQEAQIVKFGGIIEEFGLMDRTQVADSSEKQQIKYYIDMREAVPEGVNRRIGERKRAEAEKTGKPSKISKTAGDMIVPFDKLGDMMALFRDKFGEGFDVYTWGHASDGNMHINVIPQTSEQMGEARNILLKCGKRVIKWGGSPCSEHGVGKNPVKQVLVRWMYKRKGINEMKQIKAIFDPKNKMPQNIFSLAA